MKFVIFLLILNIFILLVRNENILYVSLTPSTSHNLWDQSLALGLRDKGHNLTFITTYTLIKNEENFTAIIMEGIHERIFDSFNLENLGLTYKWNAIMAAFDWIQLELDLFIETKVLDKLTILTRNKQTFELVILDGLTGYLAYPLIEQLNFPPIIGVTHLGLIPYFINFFGHNLETASVPFCLTSFSNEMSFTERLENFIYSMAVLLYRQYVVMPAMWKQIQQHVGKNNFHFEEIERNFSLLFVNADTVFHYPMSLPPAIISVAGLHIKKPKELPKDLQHILNYSRHGAILVSFGTNLPVSKLKKDAIKEFIKVFENLEQTVIWKSDVNFTNLAKNIFIRNWLPQIDILAHSNIKLFITHGGALSTYEALYHEVPLICIPVFADQPSICTKIKKREIGLTLDYRNLENYTIYKAITEVIYNSKYKSNIHKLSKRFKDQPEDPMTRAIWWAEYTIRNKGAQHLHISPRDMPSYQTLLLDVVLFLLSILFIVICLFKYVCVKLWKMFRFKIIRNVQKKNL